MGPRLKIDRKGIPTREPRRALLHEEEGQEDNEHRKTKKSDCLEGNGGMSRAVRMFRGNRTKSSTKSAVKYRMGGALVEGELHLRFN